MKKDKNELVKSITGELDKLIENIGKIDYGKCAVIVTVHQSKPVSIKHEVTKTITQKQEINQNEIVM